MRTASLRSHIAKLQLEITKKNHWAYGLPSQATRALERAGIKSRDELKQSLPHLDGIYGLGTKSVTAIREWIGK